MKTIWFVYPYGPIVGEKGLDFRYTRFAYVLAEKGYNVIWWTSNFSHSLKVKRSKEILVKKVLPNYSIVLVPSSTYKKNISIGRVLFELKFSKKLGKYINKEHKPDLIMTSGTGLLTGFSPIYEYGKKNNVPLIYDIMDIHMINPYMSSNHKILAPIVRFITRIIEIKEKRFYKIVSGVTGLGRNQLNVAISRTGNRNIPTELVYNGINVDKLRLDMKHPAITIRKMEDENWIYCIYAGALGPSYDIECILKAAEHAKNMGDNIKFIICGSGPQSEIVERASENNDRILYLGILNPLELAGIYSQCDVGLCTYASYSTVDMPDKFYDYCAAGLVIINSLYGEIKEHIFTKNLGYHYQSGNYMDLYKKIALLTDSRTMSKFKKNSYDIAYEFDIRVLVDKLVNMMDKIIEMSK